MTSQNTEALDRMELEEDMEKLVPYLPAAATLIAGKYNGTPRDKADVETVRMAIRLRQQVRYHVKHGLD